MMRLAGSMPREELSARAYDLYESFGPRIPSGVRGWEPRASSISVASLALQIRLEVGHEPSHRRTAWQHA